MSDNIIIIPTYKERENIENISRAVLGLPQQFHMLVVDDNSPDGTQDIVRHLQKEFPERLHLLARPGKQGLGTAYIAGFRWALERGYQFITEMDADFSHNPLDVPKLYAAAQEKGDVAIGSRYKSGVNVVNWPMSRVLLSFFASVYVRFITRMDVHDATAGFVCYKSRVLQTIDLDKIRFKGYAFQIEMKFKAWKHGFALTEVPIIFTDRQEGQSKMNSGIIREAAFGVLSLKIGSWFKKYKKYQG